jgi:5-methylcytosine-specific restriction endonuclease McrA
MRICSEPGCPEFADDCAEHRAKQRNGSTRQWRKVRAAVLKRDNERCFYCGEQATTVDHLRPVSRGGTDDESNLAAACPNCNGIKGSHKPAELGW